MKAIALPLLLALALVITACGLRAALSPMALQWSQPERRIVLVQSDVAAANTRLREKIRASGATLRIADPAAEEVDSIYGPCLGVAPNAYAWQSRECATAVRAQTHAGTALFLTREGAAVTLTAIELAMGNVAWTASAEAPDWNNASAADAALDRLLKGAPF